MVHDCQALQAAGSTLGLDLRAASPAEALAAGVAQWRSRLEIGR
jgi:hypothetical protein